MPTLPVLRQQRLILFLEELGLVPGVPLLGHYRSPSARDMLAEHVHPGIMEICYLARGRQVYRVGGHDYAMSAGDVFVTLPNEEHSTGGQPEERGELYWVQVQPARRDLLNMAPRAMRAVMGQLEKLPARHFTASAELREMFPRYFACAATHVEKGTGDEVARLELCAMTAQLLVEVARSAASSQVRDRDHSDMNRAIRFIQANIVRPIELGELAAVTGLSQSWFKSRFRRAMGIPPGEYVLREKVAMARQLLAAGHRVTDVAMRLGFSSSQYFATVFRRFTGMRPSEFGRNQGTRARGRAEEQK